MNGREHIIKELIQTVESIILIIEEHENAEPDLAVAHELAEHLYEEIESLQSG